MSEEIFERILDLESRLASIESQEQQYQLRLITSHFLTLPGLRGFWPMSSFNELGYAYDLSGQGRELTYNGNPVYSNSGLAPLIVLDGTGDYLSRADAAWLDITGTETYVAPGFQGLTLGGWFRFTNAAGAAEVMMSKWNVAGNERSYILTRNVAGTLGFSVTPDGINLTSVASTSSPAASEQLFCAARFSNNANTIKIWYNDETDSVAYNNTIWPGTADFVLGGRHGGLALMTGRLSLQFLCAAALPDAMINELFLETKHLFSVA